MHVDKTGGARTSAAAGSACATAPPAALTSASACSSKASNRCTSFSPARPTSAAFENGRRSTSADAPPRTPRPITLPSSSFRINPIEAPRPRGARANKRTGARRLLATRRAACIATRRPRLARDRRGAWARDAPPAWTGVEGRAASSRSRPDRKGEAKKFGRQDSRPHPPKHNSMPPMRSVPLFTTYSTLGRGAWTDAGERAFRLAWQRAHGATSDRRCRAASSAAAAAAVATAIGRGCGHSFLPPHKAPGSSAVRVVATDPRPASFCCCAAPRATTTHQKHISPTAAQ
eukprot:365205-Chlamydomonas_euryale.AAC.19